MSWNNQGGWQSGGGGGRGPWGQGPRGGGGGGMGPQPPNLEELLKKSQERFRGLLPQGGAWGGKGLGLIIAVALVLWLGSGFYRVQPDEQGVELRFGKWNGQTTLPGLNYHLPYPIETVLTPKVTVENRLDVGYRPAEPGRGQPRDVLEESLMLTGDENIVNVNFTVLWKIQDAGNYLFNVVDPQRAVKSTAESVMREVIGQNQIQAILTGNRGPIEQSVQKQMQAVLDSYRTGIEVSRVNLQKVDPPAAVIDAFRDVQAAKADRERAQNEAEAYRNDIIPRARGEAEKIIQGAEAYKQEVIANAEGEAARFISVLNEYRQAKDVTSRRLYLETMEQVLRGMNKVVIDQPQGSQGVLPYLPLNELTRNMRPAGQPAPQGAPR